MSLNLGKLADQLYAKNEEIAAINARLKDVEGEKKALENKMLASMQEAGTDIIRGSNATVSISESVKPQLQDWDEFTRFVLRKKALHLLQRRIAEAAYRELKESLGNKPVPGVSEYTHIRLNIRRS